MLNFKKKLEFHRFKKLIEKSHLFDPVWYLKQYPDIKNAHITPLKHFYFFGIQEGRNPNPYFNTNWYLSEYPDIARSDLNPLAHYLLHGVLEGRNPNPHFHTGWYLEQYQDVAESGMNPLQHYIEIGVQEGRDPGPYFHSQWYSGENLDISQSNMPPFQHYLLHGIKERRNPNPYFDAEWYLNTNPDLEKDHPDPLDHFQKTGENEKRSPCPYFDPTWYLEHYQDVAKSGASPLRHYIEYGVNEGRSPGPHFHSKWYIFQYPDVGNSTIPPLLHYLKYGIKEGKNPNPYFDTSWYLRQYPEVQSSGIEPLRHHLTYGIATFRDSQQMEWQQRETLPVVPHYIDPERVKSASCSPLSAKRVALHLHLNDESVLDSFLTHLALLPVSFDLHLSIAGEIDRTQLEQRRTNKPSTLQNIVVNRVSPESGDLQALILTLGERLQSYDIIGHFNTSDSGREAYDSLLDSPEKTKGRVGYILELLQQRAKFIYSQPTRLATRDISGWCGHTENAQKLLKQRTQYQTEDYPVIDYPEHSTFWTRAECLQDFVKIQQDGLNCDEIQQALLRLLPIFSLKYPGELIRLQQQDSLSDYRYREPQKDYSKKIIQQDIRVLSFYLPQFHPTPENDLWHGKGFTEWTKVRAANPLFRGHYQQHIPHPDTGYYLLDSSDILKKQADQMKQAGVNGQVFYHYWFSGKLILESAARMLLANKDIPMDFCFCWANENWTRKWDGNEDEILLGQDYSNEDARAFIQYLIPFFKDPRYITIEGRPVIFIYRPSSIPDPHGYLDIWAEECRINNLPQPYVTAVLTRGATDPRDFGMDAGVERVLHDWTAGLVPEMKDSLHEYTSLKGSVLSYDRVADFYSGQVESKDFTYFRSLVPQWDNTPRYGDEALLLHMSTPEKFQQWLEKTIEYTKITVPEDRRFILVNAWNEWAEGAHLEPDTMFGYGYLNSVGRALSGLPYQPEWNRPCSIPMNLSIRLLFSGRVSSQLKEDNQLRQRFIHNLEQPAILKSARLQTNEPHLFLNSALEISQEENTPDFSFEIQDVGFFAPSIFEQMIMEAIISKESAILANSYGKEEALPQLKKNSAVFAYEAAHNPLLLFPGNRHKKNITTYKVRPNANWFLTYPKTNETLPRVTTIIRHHRRGDLKELRNALYCLAAMKDCRVIPFIAAQDLSPEQEADIRALLLEIPWHQGIEPRLEFYQTDGGTGDLRSKMLNESLQKVETKYAAFLDYDDRLMPHAYAWHIDRLQKTGKAISFGRVFHTVYDDATGRLLERKVCFEYGYSYRDFVNHNHAPLHSFLLDITQLNTQELIYYDDQKYMEDYLMMLQLVTEDNADWDGLKDNMYVGDYFFSTDRVHTLAISNDQELGKVLSDRQYIVASHRIRIIKQRFAAAEIQQT